MGLVFFLARHFILFLRGLAYYFLKRLIFLKKNHGLCAYVFLISAHNPDIATQNSFLAIRSSLSAV